MIVRDVMTDEHAEALPDGRRLEELPKRPVQTGASYHAMFVDVRPRKLEQGLCQSCVRYTLKPRSNSVIYGNIPMHIVVARSR
jgi:hypothetical protein